MLPLLVMVTGPWPELTTVPPQFERCKGAGRWAVSKPLYDEVVWTTGRCRMEWLRVG